MILRFESTIDELIEANELALARSETTRSSLRRGAIRSSVLSWVLTFLPFVALALVFQTMALFILIVGLIAATFAAGTAPSRFRRIFSEQLYKHFKELLGGKETFPFEMEINKEEIRIRQMETRIIYEWSNVEEVVETDDKIIFNLRNHNLILLRKKDFPSTEMLEKFQREVAGYLNYSRTSSNWLRDDEME